MMIHLMLWVKGVDKSAPFVFLLMALLSAKMIH